jgi:pimeloyl-ACP methyl ester carboxylesterase
MQNKLKKLVLVTPVIIALLLIVYYALYMPFPGSSARTADGGTRIIVRDGRDIAYHVRGEGPRILLSASAGREASDFNELTRALVDAGYRTIAVDAPGIGETAMIEVQPTLYDLADDIMAALDDDCAGEPGCRAAAIGHAFGNRVVRAAAARNPSRIRQVVLIAAGGRNEIDERASAALRNAFDSSLTTAQREEDIRYAFFAGDNVIPDHWMVGWYQETATMQGRASPATRDNAWLAAGTGSILVVQGAEDRIAPQEDTADVIAAAYPGRVEIAVINNAGHALLPERPDAVEQAVLDFLGRRIAENDAEEADAISAGDEDIR